MELVFIIIGSYLLGSIPFGLILTRLGGYGDIRNIGSGNIGATNVLRTGNKKLALLTLVLDALKGATAILIVQYLYLTFSGCENYERVPFIADSCDHSQHLMDLKHLAGLSALVGHLFPIWLKFKGGKGVATTLGILLTLPPLIPGVVACFLWLLTAAVTRYSSLSALIAIGSTPIISFIILLWAEQKYSGGTLVSNQEPPEWYDFTMDWYYSPIFCFILATLIFFKHRSNIHRLLKGEEPKIGQKK